LILAGLWSEKRHTELEQELDAEVRAAGTIAESHGTLKEGERIPASSMFDDVYKVMPPHLVAQRTQAGL
jgi:2-oxoisovalerate dehydrogenase E1 component alpha subunit